MTIGQAISRPDGDAKVRGEARYAADQPAADMLHGVYVTSPVAAGRLLAIDRAAALARPGVVAVWGWNELPAFVPSTTPPQASAHLPMQGERIAYEGEPVALVLATSALVAAEAAACVELAIAPLPFVTPAAAELARPERGNYVYAPVDVLKGDVEAAEAAATHRVDASYTQPARHPNAIEPMAVLAQWDGEQLTLHDSVQSAFATQRVVARALGLAPGQVRVIAPHTGGGFGSKGYVWLHEILAAHAARVTGRPVRIVLRRADLVAGTGYQPAIRQRVVLAADDQGRLRSVRHEVENTSSLADDFTEYATFASAGSYATPALRLSQRIRHANVNVPSAMRAPMEGPGSWALESAMDELAERLGLDPLELRLRNHAEVDPLTSRPWSSKKLREAYAEGARRFGWWERSREPVRDGDWLLGTGMATCTMSTLRYPARARVRLFADGRARAEGCVHDIGTGVYAVLPQVVASALGLDVSQVSLVAGDTALPETAPTYGSATTLATGGALHAAALNLVARLAALPEARPRRSWPEVMRAAGLDEVCADGQFTLPDGAAFDEGGGTSPWAMRTFGAIFVEVAVDPELGLLRLRRAVGSYSAGRIVNPKTARSQIVGGIAWGWGMAALESAPHEPALGRFLHKDLAGARLPVHADIPGAIDVHFVDEFDPHAGPLGAKGIGELGATGVAAAVANAVRHATGRRVRALPIRPAALLPA